MIGFDEVETLESVYKKSGEGAFREYVRQHYNEELPVIEDDGVNDVVACYLAFKKLEAEGYWEEVARRHGLTLRSSVASSANSGEASVPGLLDRS